MQRKNYEYFALKGIVEGCRVILAHWTYIIVRLEPEQTFFLRNLNTFIIVAIFEFEVREI